jgi:hypothetical protein
MSQGCKGRERRRPIPSTSNITICYKCSGRNWGRSGQRPAGPGCLAGISSFASSVGQNQQDIAKVAYDPAHIQDCNVQASVGKHFLFNEPIPKGVNGRGYLRVTKKSLWWQHEQFPNVWTSEGLTTCMENGYQWTVNSTTWNHLQTMWQAPPLDLLRLIYEETHHQTILEASGYRSPTSRRTRKSASLNSRVIDTGSSGARPSRKTWPHNYFGSTVNVSLSANVRDRNRWAKVKQSPREASTLPGCIKTRSLTRNKQKLTCVKHGSMRVARTS